MDGDGDGGGGEKARKEEKRSHVVPMDRGFPLAELSPR